MMRRSPAWQALALLAALAGCAPRPETAAPAGTASAGPQCRVGPDGGPVLTERGIGGTGAPADATRQAERGLGGTGIGKEGDPVLAERGIGGTGAPSLQQAERGIGGTGIVGVITGFASICLAGQEVALEPGVPVMVESRVSTPSALRAGQVAVVEATGSGGALQARRVEVRYEVTGPVEAAEADGALRIAGQRVLSPSRAAAPAPPAGEAWPRRGDWVAVSGLRRPDGSIQATRLDSMAPGTARVHGVLQREAGAARIGGLEIRGVPQALPEADRGVIVTGRYENGILRAESVVPDPLVTDPTAYFGRQVRAFVLESFVAPDGRMLRLGPGIAAAMPPGLGNFAGGRAVVELVRGGDGGLLVSALRTAGAPPAGGGPPGGRGGGPGRGPGQAPGDRPSSGFPPWRGGGMPDQARPGGPGPGNPSPGGFGPGGGPGGGPRSFGPDGFGPGGFGRGP
ncbi:MAG: DUF5666 domain-containing protein, partial [Paracraurococcus sp.]